MNENLNLAEILKDCKKGTKLYSPIFGEVEFNCIYNDISGEGSIECESEDGVWYFNIDGTITIGNVKSQIILLYPSKDQRDWSKFMTKQSEMEELCESQEITKWAYISDPLQKQPKFDPKTLQPFDKVLVRDSDVVDWKVQLFSRIIEDEEFYPYVCINESYKYCIPYNDDTKHLVGTTYEAPEFYKY